MRDLLTPEQKAELLLEGFAKEGGVSFVGYAAEEGYDAESIRLIALAVPTFAREIRDLELEKTSADEPHLPPFVQKRFRTFIDIFAQTGKRREALASSGLRWRQVTMARDADPLFDVELRDIEAEISTMAIDDLVDQSASGKTTATERLIVLGVTQDKFSPNKDRKKLVADSLPSSASEEDAKGRYQIITGKASA